MRDVTAQVQANRRRDALQAVTRVLAESATLDEATPRILRTLGESAGWDFGAIWEPDPAESVLRCVDLWRRPGGADQLFEAATRDAEFPPGVGLPGRVWASRQPPWISDAVRDSNFPRAALAARCGLHGGFAFPILCTNGQVCGVIEFFSRRLSQPDDELLAIFGALGSQIGQFIERTRMERRLRDEEALYHSLVETLPLNIFRKDREGRFTFGNGRFLQELGRPLDEVRGKTDFDFYPHELAEKYRADDVRVMQSEELFETTEEHVRPGRAQDLRAGAEDAGLRRPRRRGRHAGHFLGCHRSQKGRGGAAPGARGRRGRQPRQEHLPGQHESRDPHAHGGHHRHDRAGPRHAP